MSTRGLGKMLRSLRKRKEWSQVDVAKKAKVSQAYIAKLETGVKKNPSLATLKRIAKALGVSVEQLLK